MVEFPAMYKLRKYGIIIFFSAFSILCTPLYSFAQGCSDAGFCSIGSMKAGADNDTLNSSITASQAFGMGEQHTLVFTSQLRIKLKLLKHGFLSVQAPYSFITGNLGNISGAGDVSISYSHQIIQEEDYFVMFTMGGKIPSGVSDRADSQGRDLPMPYQTSLGTNDLMAGVKLVYSNWHFSLGYQHAFNRNQNAFLHGNWQGNEDAQKYFESNGLKRGDDLMARIERRFENPRNIWYIGILPIYRIQKDEIFINDESISLDGSSGITLNLNSGVTHKFSEKTNLNMSLGFPTLFRKVRADGLTRLFVFSAGIEYKF